MAFGIGSDHHALGLAIGAFFLVFLLAKSWIYGLAAAPVTGLGLPFVWLKIKAGATNRFLGEVIQHEVGVKNRGQLAGGAGQLCLGGLQAGLGFEDITENEILANLII